MKILITGGAGFIGSNLAESFLKDGYFVSVIDNLSTGSLDNLEPLRKYKKFKFYFGSVLNLPLLSKLISSCDIIFHLAAAVGVELIIKDPIGTIGTDIKGTDIVLDLASRKGKGVVMASTSEVYGKLRRDKFNESNDLILGPTVKSRWCYAASKIVDEFLGLAYYRKKGMPLMILRFFNIVGPNQTGAYGMVLPRFISSALLNKPILVYGDGKQSRTFLHVKDAVNAIRKLFSKRKLDGQIYNIGNTEGISIYKLARKVKEITNSSSEIKLLPYSKAYEKGFEDLKRRMPDIGKLRRSIDWHPEFKLENIIKDIVSHQLSKQ